MGRFGILMFLWVAGFAQAQGMSFLSGIIQYSEYESTLPCTTNDKKPCQSTRGTMGYALDNASQAGLEILKVDEKPGLNTKAPQIFITSQKFGTCRVETSSESTLGPLGFSCSSSGINNSDLIKVDRLLSLTSEDDQFSLHDVTQSSQLKIGL